MDLAIPSGLSIQRGTVIISPYLVQILVLLFMDIHFKMIIKTDVFLKESIGGGAHGAARNLPTFPAGIEVVRESTGYTKPSTKTYSSQDKANPMVKKMNIAFFEHSIINQKT